MAFIEKVKITDTDGDNILLGQKTMAGSVPVTLASDQPVSSVKLTDGTDTLGIGPITSKTAVITSSGDNTVLAVSPGTIVRLYHVSFVPTTSSTVDINVIVKIGATEITGWRTNTNGGGFSRTPKSGQGWWAGADGEDIVINLSAADSIRYNIEYEII